MTLVVQSQSKQVSKLNTSAGICLPGIKSMYVSDRNSVPTSILSAIGSKNDPITEDWPGITLAIQPSS